MRNLVFFFAIAMLMLGCIQTVDHNAVIEEGQHFDSEETGSLTINNQASFDVVIFAGKVNNNIIMGGIKAGESRIFDLTQLPLPEKSGAFLVRAVSYNTYTSSGILIEEEDVIYTGLVVYNTNDPNDKINLDISARISDNQDGEYIYVMNESSFVLELHLDSPTGMKLTTIAPFHSYKKLFLKPLDGGLPYSFYATYIYIDPKTNEIRSFVTNDFNDSQHIIPSTESVSFIRFSGPKDTSDKLEDMRMSLFFGD